MLKNQNNKILITIIHSEKMIFQKCFVTTSDLIFHIEEIYSKSLVFSEIISLTLNGLLNI